MFAPFSPQPHQHLEFGNIDYRNAKYQGYLQPNSQQREGIGMVLDRNYLLALAHWRGNQIEGSAFVLFPDGSLFYGQLSDGLPRGLCTFRSASGSLIHCHIEGRQLEAGRQGREGRTTVVIEDASLQQLQMLSLQSDLLLKEAKGGQLTEEHLLQSYHNNTPAQQQMKLGVSLAYNSQNERDKLLQKWLGTKWHLGFQDFISEQLMSQEEQGRLDVSEGAGGFSLKFRQSSIWCKLQTLPHTVVRQLGYYNHVTDSMQFCRRDQGSGRVEETVGQKGLLYPVGKRHSQCLSALHLYYKQSLQFVNQYFSIDYLYRLKFTLHSLEHFSNAVLTAPQGQKLLQNRNHRFSPGQQLKLSTGQDSQEWSLEQVKEDIYRAARIKNTGRSCTRTAQRDTATRTAQRDTATRTAQRDTATDSVYNVVLHHTLSEKPILVSSRKPCKSRNPNKATTQSASRRKEPSLKCPAKGQASLLSKFAYLSESREVNLQRMRHINALTDYYEGVERGLLDHSLSHSPSHSPDQRLF